MRDALLGRKPCRTSKAVALEGIPPEVGVADPAVQRVLPPHAVTPPRRPEPADPVHNHAQERSDVAHVAIDAQINGDASELLFASSGRADGANSRVGLCSQGS